MEVQWQNIVIIGVTEIVCLFYKNRHPENIGIEWKKLFGKF